MCDYVCLRVTVCVPVCVPVWLPVCTASLVVPFINPTGPRLCRRYINTRRHLRLVYTFIGKIGKCRSSAIICLFAIQRKLVFYLRMASVTRYGSIFAFLMVLKAQLLHHIVYYCILLYLIIVYCTLLYLIEFYCTLLYLIVSDWILEYLLQWTRVHCSFYCLSCIRLLL